MIKFLHEASIKYLITLFVLCTNERSIVLAQNIDFGKSYINVTKGLNGGTVETGDTLEIRASLVVRSGRYDSCRYQDVVPAGTAYITGTVRVLTNEGKIYKQFTDVAGDDPGWISGANITINLGYNQTDQPATSFRRGRVRNTHKPSFFGGTCIMIASFRVRVTAPTGTNISTGGGNMTYRSGTSPVQTFTFPANLIRVFSNYGICSNTIGVNAIGTETNGTFGSGRPRNRGASANVPVGYTYQFFTTNQPNDYNYGIANNTSTLTNYTTSNAWPKPDPSTPTHRVFGVWDIIGDHTGAASPTAGNAAADTVANGNAGYMLIVNAAYRIDSAFQQTISGLCPNTYYEISCWIRNICSKCGCDSNGVGASGAGYIPTAAGDSAGVRPNLTFEVDGIDYYTTGNILYTGNWIKKGFTYLTGPFQTSFTLKFFNNAPGGGGNDWALDDISVSTCSPNMVYAPSNNPKVCDSNSIQIQDTIRSFFNNYVYYKWQRSTDGGGTWTDVTAPAGPVVPFWNGSAWEYVSTYNIPPSATTLADNGDMYRLIVATTLGNLTNPDCSFTDNTSIITLEVIDCQIPLAVKLISFKGEKNGSTAILKWATENEEETYIYEIEKSVDGAHFTKTGQQFSYNHPGSNHYTFTDLHVAGKTYYRIKIINNQGQYYYSKTILLNGENGKISFLTVINPFAEKLEFSLFNNANDAGVIALLIDLSGRVILRKNIMLQRGENRVVFENTNTLAAGIYFLSIKNNQTSIQQKVYKQYR